MQRYDDLLFVQNNIVTWILYQVTWHIIFYIVLYFETKCIHSVCH